MEFGSPGDFLRYAIRNKIVGAGDPRGPGAPLLQTLIGPAQEST